jgi:hypothetical protein
MYLVLHECDWTIWHSCSLCLNSSMASSKYWGLCCLPIWGNGRFWRKCTRTNGVGRSAHRAQWFSIKRFQFFQSTVATSGIPTVFPHEPLPPTSATPINSTGWNLKAANLSSQLSILKQGTCYTRSTPRSAKIISFSVYNTELEEKTGMWPTDTGKKLSYRKSLCEKHRMQQKESERREHFLWKN